MFRRSYTVFSCVSSRKSRNIVTCVTSESFVFNDLQVRLRVTVLNGWALMRTGARGAGGRARIWGGMFSILRNFVDTYILLLLLLLEKDNNNKGL